MQLFSSLIGMLALGSSAVHATAWVVGYQSSGYTGWNIRQVRSLYCLSFKQLLPILIPLPLVSIQTSTLETLAWLATSSDPNLAPLSVPSAMVLGRNGMSSATPAQATTTSTASTAWTTSTTMPATLGMKLGDWTSMVLRWQPAILSTRQASCATLIRLWMPTTGLVMFGLFVKTRCVSIFQI